MPYAFTQDVPIDASFYERIVAGLGDELPDGLIIHVAVERREGGLRYYSVWESEEAADDLVRRDFTADAPNRLWLADLTEHRTDEGKLYLAAIKDVFSNRIVGWAIDERMKARLVVAALEMAVARRDGDVAGRATSS
jgi:transposase InsO family protein